MISLCMILLLISEIKNEVNAVFSSELDAIISKVDSRCYGHCDCCVMCGTVVAEAGGGRELCNCQYI